MIHGSQLTAPFDIELENQYIKLNYKKYRVQVHQILLDNFNQIVKSKVEVAPLLLFMTTK
jgi:hypothetical protein